MTRVRPHKERVPYKLKPEVEEAILRHLRAGAFLKHACEAAGIRYRTLKYWMDAAEDGDRRFEPFALKVLRLQAEDAIRSQSIITRAMMGRIDGDWKAAAWNLERKYPKEYGQAAMQAAASVTLRSGGAANSDNSDGVTTVQFYLPDNGRRPQDEADEG